MNRARRFRVGERPSEEVSIPLDQSTTAPKRSTRRQRALSLLAAPFRRLRARWRHEWSWGARRRLFEVRHYRRLWTLIVFLLVSSIVWVAFVIGGTFLLGRADLLRGPAFLQNVLASLLVLPVGVAAAVVAATMLEKHALRFKAQRAADELANCFSHSMFMLVLVLQRECGVDIDLTGPTDYRFAQRALDAAVKAFSRDSYQTPLPANFGEKLEGTVASMSECFRRSTDLHLAFPHAFDLMFDLEKLMASIKRGDSTSGPHNTTVIMLNFAIRILRDLE